jgi:hypothetical protein
MSRLVYAAVASFVMTGVLLAGTYSGLITAVSKDEVKITVKAKKKGEKGEEKTFKAKNLKIMKGEEEVSIEAFGEQISKAKAKGVFGKLTTEGDGDAEVAVKIEYGGKKKKTN